MASLYPPGVENPRRTHENAIKRMERFTQLDKFNQLSVIELETHLTMFDKSFTDFTVEHEKLIVKLRDPKNFTLEDNYYVAIQEIYRSSVIKFRKQMDKVERENLLRSMASRARKSARVQTMVSGELKTTKPTEPSTNQQQQQHRQTEYEREQRRQRTVQLNDAVIHERRTREWIERLPNEEEAKLERKRHQINMQLAELDRKQRELDERAQRIKSPNQKERSRSPAVQFHVEVPSTSRALEIKHFSGDSANIRRPIGRNDMRHWLNYRDSGDGASTSQHENFGNIRSAVVSTNSSNVRNQIGAKRIWNCHFCNGPHKMYQCERFLNLNRGEREQHVTVLKLCKNCFMPSEDGRHRCRFGRCDNCGIGQFHNSLLCPVRYPR